MSIKRIVYICILSCEKYAACSDCSIKFFTEFFIHQKLLWVVAYSILLCFDIDMQRDGKDCHLPRSHLSWPGQHIKDGIDCSIITGGKIYRTMWMGWVSKWSCELIKRTRVGCRLPLHDNSQESIQMVAKVEQPPACKNMAHLHSFLVNLKRDQAKSLKFIGILVSGLKSLGKSGESWVPAFQSPGSQTHTPQLLPCKQSNFTSSWLISIEIPNIKFPGNWFLGWNSGVFSEWDRQPTLYNCFMSPESTPTFQNGSILQLFEFLEYVVLYSSMAAQKIREGSSIETN